MNQNCTHFGGQISKKYIFFGVLQNSSTSFMCATRWERLEITGLEYKVSLIPGRAYSREPVTFCSVPDPKSAIYMV